MDPMSERTFSLSREEILLGLEKVNARLKSQGTRGELCLYGGACMCLAFAARSSTKDIDAVFEPAATIRKAAHDVAAEMGWSWNWLNDDVKGFVSTHGPDGTVLFCGGDFSHLTIHAAKPEYLLAMKVLAARSGHSDDPAETAEMSVDLQDAVWLCGHLGFVSREQIVGEVLRYFPDREPPERTQFFIEELLVILRLP